MLRMQCALGLLLVGMMTGGCSLIKKGEGCGSSCEARCTKCKTVVCCGDVTAKCGACGHTVRAAEMSSRCTNCRASLGCGDCIVTCPACKKEAKCSAFQKTAQGALKCSCGKETPCGMAQCKCPHCKAPVSCSDMMKCPKCGKQMNCTGQCSKCASS